FPNVAIDAGEYLVAAADVDVFKAVYPWVTNVVGGWDGKLSNSGETIELVDGFGIRIDRVRYFDQGDWGVRELGPRDYGHRGWLWISGHDGGGKSLELINADMPNEYGQNWSASSRAGGTPGMANSVAADNIAPIILDVMHWPVIPGADEPVTISAYIVDESTTGITAVLYYRRDGDSGFETLAMFDDGQHGDDESGDSIYGAHIPAQADGTVVEFYVMATDAGSNLRTWPAPCTVDGAPQQSANALYQVDDSSEPDAGWVPGDQPIYRLIMTARELTELEDIADRNYEGNLFASEAMSSAQMNATFISMDGVYTTVRYGVGVRNRGNRKRADPPMSYHINFRRDDLWKGVKALNLNSKYPHLELMGSVLMQMAGLPSADAAVVQLRVNGRNLAASDYSRTYGSYTALEVLDDDWAGRHFPDDSAGNLYRCTYYEDGVHPRTVADLDHKEAPGRTPNPDDYRNNYIKKTNEADDDWSDLFALIDKLNDDNISDADFIAEVGKVVNLEKWTRFLAADALVGNREGGLTSGTGDDYAMYRGVEDPRFWLVPHDLDTVLGQGDHDYQPQRDIFAYAGVAGLKRLLNHPDVIRLYYRQYKDLIETIFAPENFDPAVDRLLGDWVPNSEIEGPRGIKQFVRDRANSILYGGYPGDGDAPQIPQLLTVTSSLPVVNGFHRTSIPVAVLSGTVNAIETRSVSVNGQLVTESDFSQRRGTWSIRNIILNPGVNRVIVQAFDGPNGTGSEIDRGLIDIWYDTGSTNDYPKSNTMKLSETNAGSTLRMVVRDSYLPGIPVLIRVEILDDEGSIDRSLWDAAATLSVPDNPDIRLSTDQVTLYNGLGSELVTFTGGGDFTLTVEVNGLQTGAILADWSDQPVSTVSGGISKSQTWSGIYHITGGDFTIPGGVTLTLDPGTLVLIDGASSGTDGTDIDVTGSIRSLGTADSPVTLTAYVPGENWGELHHVDAGPSTFNYTNITLAGRSPRVGHSNSGPAIRASNSTFVFENCSLTDNAGKLGDITSDSDLTFRNCLFARSVMGPEISGTALLFENSWITDMHADDDADGIYIHGQRPGQLCTMIHGVAANIDDDGIDTLSSDVTIEDFIIRDCRDKGVSIYNGQVDINYCLIVENNKAPEDPTIATIATKTVNGATAVVNIDHTTIVASSVQGYRDVGIQSHNKTGVT
ncbi:MAG: CotH kinase family protein, partial [Planctomycetota bacterium]